MLSATQQQLREFLPQEQPFTRELIREFFERAGEKLTEEALKVRVNRLKAKGLLVNIGRGWYRLNDKKIFEPELTPTIKKLNSKVKKAFPYLNYVLWSTEWLNQLVTLQLLKNQTVMEVEAGSEESVFRQVKDFFAGKTYLNPSETEWTNYIAEKEEAIIIRSLISESPKGTTGSVKTPRLEKILVDLYCDKLWQVLFSAELDAIYNGACTTYAINFSTLLSYASRRGKRLEIWNYIKCLQVVDAATINLIEK